MNPSERRVHGWPNVPPETKMKSAGPKVPSEARPYDFNDKITEGLGTLRAFREALSDLSAITETLIEDLEFLARQAEMDRKWKDVMP